MLPLPLSDKRIGVKIESSIETVEAAFQDPLTEALDTNKFHYMKEAILNELSNFHSLPLPDEGDITITITWRNEISK